MSISKDYVENLRRFYHLEPLPVEGGLFRRTYLSAEHLEQEALPFRYPEAHPFGSAILYMMNGDPDCFSALHVLPTDEVYHFYLGDPVEMLLLYPDGHSEHIILGQDIFSGQQVQFVAPRGVWQGSHLRPGGSYALIGTTMAPGFIDSDYVGGVRENLKQQYPKESSLIQQLTRD